MDARIDQPNPLGAGVIPTVFRVTMDSATSDSADLQTTTTYDAAALRQMTAAIVAQIRRLDGWIIRLGEAPKR